MIRILQLYDTFALRQKEDTPPSSLLPKSWKGAPGRKGIQEIWPTLAVVLSIMAKLESSQETEDILLQSQLSASVTTWHWAMDARNWGPGTSRPTSRCVLFIVQWSWGSLWWHYCIPWHAHSWATRPRSTEESRFMIKSCDTTWFCEKSHTTVGLWGAGLYRLSCHFTGHCLWVLGDRILILSFYLPLLQLILRLNGAGFYPT
jgi:hypothetical protein